MKFCRILADSQNHRRNTGNFTDTRLTAATKPLIIQRFLTLAKVALRLFLPAQRASEAWQVLDTRKDRRLALRSATALVAARSMPPRLSAFQLGSPRYLVSLGAFVEMIWTFGW